MKFDEDILEFLERKILKLEKDNLKLKEYSKSEIIEEIKSIIEEEVEIDAD